MAIADLAGERWAKNARVTAVTIVTTSKQTRPSLGIQLLHDIRSVFDMNYDNKLRTEVITSGLNRIPDSPWSNIRKGEPLNANYLANNLRKYGIAPKAHRIRGDVIKGYSREQFEDAWKRYPIPIEVDDEEGSLDDLQANPL